MARGRRQSSLHLDPAAAMDATTLAAAVVAEVAAGRVGQDDPLPSTRALAAELGVARSLVVAAYEHLLAAGVVAVRAGSGARVLVDGAVARSMVGGGRTGPAEAGNDETSAGPAAGGRTPPPPEPVRYNLTPGAPDVSLISERDWRRAWRAASRTVVPARWYEPMVHPELERALVTHLRRTRGIAADPAEVIIFPGVSAAIESVVSALGARRAAMEDPGYPVARRALQRHVPAVDLLPVDDDGLPVGLLGRQDLVYVTPAHQFPLGGRMSAARRTALLRWADDSGAVVMEDDFDGEFRHDSAPLGPLRSMSGGTDRVVYIGTASKILTPHLRLAWAVVPRRMADAVRAQGAALRLDANRIASIALAEMIDSGMLARHLARVTRTYAARRHRLVAALHQYLPQWQVMGVEAGIHVAVQWNSGQDDGPVDRELVAGCAERGVLVTALSRYAERRPANGLLLGYAQLPETAAADAVAVIADVLNDLRRPRVRRPRGAPAGRARAH